MKFNVVLFELLLCVLWLVVVFFFHSLISAMYYCTILKEFLSVNFFFPTLMIIIKMDWVNKTVSGF